MHARQIRIIETRHNYMQTPPPLPFVPPLSISSFQVSHYSRWPTREPASLAACRESMNSQRPNFPTFSAKSLYKYTFSAFALMSVSYPRFDPALVSAVFLETARIPAPPVKLGGLFSTWSTFNQTLITYWPPLESIKIPWKGKNSTWKFWQKFYHNSCKQYVNNCLEPNL